MIVFFGGPEGAGKTALMTKFLRKHYLLGGEVWSFPGYELKNQKGRVVSKLINPAEIMGKIDDMQYVALAIDEIQNFSHHHAWQSPLNNVLSYGAMAQRRKRQFNILATGPEFRWLPPDLQMMFHIYVACRDKRWSNKDLERGEQIEFVMRDLRGVLTGRPGTYKPPQTFWPKSLFRYYETFSIVDPKYQHLKIKVQKDEIIVDSKGNIIDNNENGIDDSIEIAKEIAKLKATNKTKIEGWELSQIMGKLGFRMNASLKSLLNSLGVHYSRYEQCYLID